MDSEKIGNMALNFLKEKHEKTAFAVFEHKTSCLCYYFVLRLNP